MSRDSDIEVVPTCRREGISLIPYSPLKGYEKLFNKYAFSLPSQEAVHSVLSCQWIS